MKVEATKKGFFNKKLIREGEVFEINPIEVGEGKKKKAYSVDDQFSESWMKKVDGRSRKVKLESASADALNPSAPSYSS